MIREQVYDNSSYGDWEMPHVNQGLILRINDPQESYRMFQSQAGVARQQQLPIKLLVNCRSTDDRKSTDRQSTVSRQSIRSSSKLSIAHFIVQKPSFLSSPLLHKLHGSVISTTAYCSEQFSIESIHPAQGPAHLKSSQQECFIPNVL